MHIDYYRGISLEDSFVLKKIDEIFIKKRGHTSQLPPPHTPVVLLFSGGLDSVCLCNLLLKKYRYHVYPLYLYKHNKRNRQEEKSINLFENLFKQRYGAQFHSVEKREYPHDFDLRKSEMQRIFEDLYAVVPNLIKLHKHDTHFTTTVATSPARTPFLALRAYEYAFELFYTKKTTVRNVFMSLLPDDAQLFRSDTLTSLKGLNLIYSLLQGDYRWQLLAPFDRMAGFYYKRIDLVREALQDELPLGNTWTCGAGFRTHCGECLACKMRKETFHNLEVIDPTVYRKVTLIDKIRNRILLFLRARVTQQEKPHNDKGVDQNRDAFQDTISKNDRLRLAADIIWEEIEGVGYVFNQRTGMLEGLSEVGTFIIKQIDRRDITVTELISLVQNEYDENTSQIADDVTAFVNEYYAEGYIVRADS